MTEQEFLNAFEKATGARPVKTKITIKAAHVYQVKISDLKEFGGNTAFMLDIDAYFFNFSDNKMGFTTTKILN